MSDGLPEEPQTSETLTFLQIAELVLGEERKSLTANEIWDKAVNAGYHTKLGMYAKRGIPASPVTNLQAQIGRSIRDDPDTAFSMVPDTRPMRYYLKGSIDQNEIDSLQQEAQSQPISEQNSDESEQDDREIKIDGLDDSEISFIEKDMHPFLVWYAKTLMGIACKTIRHNITSRSGENHMVWKHPDIMGCSIPSEKYSNSNVIRFGNKNGADLMTLYSFELKQDVKFINISKYVFQAVSNSSWANEGYLVTAEIENEEVKNELKAMSRAFGIGVILIDMASPERTEIIAPAKRKDVVDWERLDEIAKVNSDINDFIASCHLLLGVDAGDSADKPVWFREQALNNNFDPVAKSSEVLLTGLRASYTERKRAQSNGGDGTNGNVRRRARTAPTN